MKRNQALGLRARGLTLLGALGLGMAPEAQASSIVVPHPLEAAGEALRLAQVFQAAQGAEARLEAQLAQLGQSHGGTQGTASALAWWGVAGRVVKVEAPLGEGLVSYLADGEGRLVAAHLHLPFGPSMPEGQDMMRVGERYLLRVRAIQGPATSLR